MLWEGLTAVCDEPYTAGSPSEKDNFGFADSRWLTAPGAVSSVG